MLARGVSLWLTNLCGLLGQERLPVETTPIKSMARSFVRRWLIYSERRSRNPSGSNVVDLSRQPTPPNFLHNLKLTARWSAVQASSPMNLWRSQKRRQGNFMLPPQSSAAPAESE